MLDFAPWRTNPNFVGAILVAADLPPRVLGDYHLAQRLVAGVQPGRGQQDRPGLPAAAGTRSTPHATTSTTRPGPASAGSRRAPTRSPRRRPTSRSPRPTATDLAHPGRDRHVHDRRAPTPARAPPPARPWPTRFPASLTVTSWTCTATAGSSCTTGGSGNNRTGTVTLLSGGSATYTAVATVSATAAGTVSNTATVTAPAGTGDPNTADNTATDVDTVDVPLPALACLDNFNRANANTLGGELEPGDGASGQARDPGQRQPGLRRCSWAGHLERPGQRVRCQPGRGLHLRQRARHRHVPERPAPQGQRRRGEQPRELHPRGLRRDRRGHRSRRRPNSGGTNTTPGDVRGDLRLGRHPQRHRRSATGTVNVYKTSGAITTLVGTVTIPTAGAGAWTGTGGRIGIQLPTGVRVDNFSGGTVP